MSDTDDSFNFLISMCYTQLFNLLCEKADDVYGGRLPVHVRCLIDECANIGQIPKLEKLVATIRSREISACLVLQAQSQLKAIYKDNADTMMFFDDALEGERTQLLTELADAVSETRTAADQATELNEDGEAGLLRLTEIWCAMNGVPVIVIFEGGQSELLANVIAQIYAHLLQHPSSDPVGLAVYVELRYMTASLMLGEWFE